MSSDRKIIIAIDGYSSSGKSTMARHLASVIGYRYIDSGAMYRAVTLYAMRHGWATANGEPDVAAITAALPQISIDFEVCPDGTQQTLLNGENVESEIRTIEVSECVSAVAAIPEVRKALVAMQQALGRDKGIVMDGRDIGTSVFPHAELKLFVGASAECRAERRYKELTAKGEKVTLQEVLDNVRKRDYIDEHREVSPLRCADDAICVDNSDMTPERQNELLLELYHDALKKLS